jgi:hypothetical protein
MRLRSGVFDLDGTGWFLGHSHVLNGWRNMCMFLLPGGLSLQPVFQVMPVRMAFFFPHVIGDQLYFLFVLHFVSSLRHAA